MSFLKRTQQPPDAPRPDGREDRRSVCRYAVVQDNAWLGWWEGQEYKTTTAKIVDFSLRGARLQVETIPPGDQPIWFCPPGMAATDEWIEVKLIGSRKRIFGAREARISFRKVFPYEIFKAVVYGPDSFKSAVAPTWLPEDAEERDWW